MENFVLIPIISGVLITSITQLIKKHTNIEDPRIVVVGLSILAGMIYQLFVYFTPADLQASITEFALGALATATIAYDYFVKTLKK